MKGNVFDFYKPKTIPQWIIFCAATAITLSSPYGTRKFIQELNKYLNGATSNNKVKSTSKNLSQTIHRLKKERLISVIRRGDKTIIELTKNGIKKRLRDELNNMRIPKPTSWDQKWRIVLFDIPESEKKSRHLLRKRLRGLGFTQFQKSVWIHPHNCYDEINSLAEALNVGQYLTLITASIENDAPLKKLFQNILKM